MREQYAEAIAADPPASEVVDWREYARHAALRADVSLALAESGEPRAILQRCAEALVAHLDAAFARIWTIAPGAPILELQASAGRYTHLDGPHGRIPLGHLKIGLIAQERRPYLTNAVIGDPRVHEQEWARREGMIAFAGYPLIVESRLVGVMALFAQRPLAAATLDALASVAAAIGQGIERQRAERLLREREAAYRGIFEAASDGVLISDLAGRLRVATPAAGAIFGHAEADWAHLTLDQLVAPADHDRLRRALTTVAAGGQFHGQLCGQRADSGRLSLDVGGGPLDYQGRPHLLWTLRDITERVEAERLREARVQAERQRLARELHDSVAQSLYGIGLQSAAASRHLASGEAAAARESLDAITATSREALAEMRLIIFDLRPPLLAEAGLTAALRARLDTVEGRVAGLTVTLDMPAVLDLPPAIEEAFYRVAQEALNNVIKHADARQVAVTVWQDTDLIGLRIADDGAGFDQQAAAQGGGLGLRGMAERAALLGARLTIVSTPGAGTTVSLEVARWAINSAS